METIAKSDLEIVVKQLNNIEKSYNDYILETGEDTYLAVTLEDGRVVNFEASVLIDKWQKAIIEKKLVFELEDSDLKLRKSRWVRTCLRSHSQH